MNVNQPYPQWAVPPGAAVPFQQPVPLPTQPPPLVPQATGGVVRPITTNPNSGLVMPMPGNATPERAYRLKSEERSEPVIGWRRYMMEPIGGKLLLHGARMPWPEATLHAVCNTDLDTRILGMLVAEFGEKGAIVYQAYADAQRRLGRPSGEVTCESHIRDGYCQCGIYGGAYPGNTMGDGPVIAKCVAWGYVAVDEAGNWKASAARIEAIFLAKQLMSYSEWLDWPLLTKTLRERYECPVYLVQELEDIPR